MVAVWKINCREERMETKKSNLWQEMMMTCRDYGGSSGNKNKQLYFGGRIKTFERTDVKGRKKVERKTKGDI